MNRTRNGLVTGLVLVILLLIGGSFVFILAGDDLINAARTVLRQLALSGRDADLALTVSDDPTPQRFRVQLGETPASIADQLLAANLILDADLFVDYVRAEGIDTQLEAGTFFLNQAQNIPQIALSLTDSRFSVISFTVFPGWRIEQVAEAIDANPLFAFKGADFLAVVGTGAPIDPVFAAQVGLPTGASLEGFLYPDTYQLDPDITPEALRDTLLTAFTQAVIEPLGTAAAASGYTLFEHVIMASIVQREAVRLDEQPKIAGVYFNRLAINMKLDADPTVQYPLGDTRGSWWARITAADYQGVVDGYNTYLYAGFPPGPIANPGLDAIRASLYPQASEFFYFRADCRSDGYHDFARTYDEHLQNGC
ncbi:MAG: endolytic transglycosylase MltG [Armatimonadetes bacterium]|nr:endolytic transglycosylase MltG [Anaerolineae bacterium]